jgi:osmoprotectant transport system permease protein
MIFKSASSASIQAIEGERIGNVNTLNFIHENADMCWTLTLEHIGIVAFSVFLAALIAIPTGVAITRHDKIAKKIMNGANIFMTIPSIALFGLMLPVLSLIGHGLGKVPAVIALIVYSQLPIIRNTFVGIKNVPPELVDAGRGLGMNGWTRLKEIEIPLAIPVIVAGLRTAAVMNIGIAAIAAYIGAGGLGVFIQQGIARAYEEMIMTGAIMVAVLAIFVDASMALLENILTPKGVKIGRTLGQ